VIARLSVKANVCIESHDYAEMVREMTNRKLALRTLDENCGLRTPNFHFRWGMIVVSRLHDTFYRLQLP
jgi:hypothetical protein